MRTVTLTKESTKGYPGESVKEKPFQLRESMKMAVAADPGQMLSRRKIEALFGYTKEFDKADINSREYKV